MTAVVLMASGFSERFGKQNKLLVPFRGKPLALYTIDLLTGMDFPGELFFVAASDDVIALTAGLQNINVIKNTAPEKGIIESVRLGLKAVNSEYYFFFPCDQPFLDADTIRHIHNERRTGCIVQPNYMGKQGNPCLFSAVFREELLSLDNGESPRIIMTRHPEKIIKVEVKNPLILEDIDDEETLERFELFFTQN